MSLLVAELLQKHLLSGELGVGGRVEGVTLRQGLVPAHIPKWISLKIWVLYTSLFGKGEGNLHHLTFPSSDPCISFSLRFPGKYLPARQQPSLSQDIQVSFPVCRPY